MSTTAKLRELGQSVWLDYLDRELLVSGELDRKITQGGVTGLTSNPTIFQKAIAIAGSYDDIVGAAESTDTDVAILERLMVRDIRAACDRFRPVYEAMTGADGFVSIEVSPLAARDPARSNADAHRLWERVSRPNVMIKIPGTAEAIPAIRRCLVEGLNINVTLLFSVSRYQEIAAAYLEALEARVAAGKPIDRVASVASFFVSRVDAKVDQKLGFEAPVRGRIAIANAKIAYEEYERVVEGRRWRALAAKGARPQRLLWASTSPKDPAYPDVYYADALIGPDTVDTMTPACLTAFLDHGHPASRLNSDRERAHEEMADLAELGIDLPALERELEEEGIRSFVDSFTRALDAISERRRRLTAA